MPRIPTYVSSNQLTKDAPNRLVDAASFQVNDNTGDILSEQGKAIQTAAAQMERVRDIAENTSAQTASAKGFSEIHLEAVESPDIWNAGKVAQEKISKLKEDLSSKITSDIARAQFEAAFEIDSMQYKNRINAELRQRQALAATNSLVEYEDSKTAEFAAPDTSPYDQQMILSVLNEKYLEYVKAGIIRPEVAAAKFKEARERMVNQHAKNYVYNYPETSLEELQAGKNGMFKDLKEDTRLDLEKIAGELAKKNAKENERNVVIAINKTESDSLDMYRKILQTTDTEEQKALTAQLIDKVNNDRDEKLSSADFATGLIKSLTSSKAVNAVHDVATYEEIMTDITRGEIPSTEIRAKIFNARAAGKLTGENVNHLFYIEKDSGGATVFENYILEQDKLNRPKTNVWRTAWDLIKSATKGLSFGPGGAVVSAIMGRTASRAQAEGATGEKIVEIAKEEIDRQNKQANPNRTKYEIGGVVTNEKGESGEVIGYNDNGVPLIRVKRGKPTTDSNTAK
ncbi:MAG: hypothetical protein WC481_08460 [Candidatus Omnitrophota bacterium]